MRIQLPFNLNSEDKKKLDEQTKFINFLLASSVALPAVTGTSFISFLLSSNMQKVWYILNALQLASFLLMINVRFHFHTNIFLIFLMQINVRFPFHTNIFLIFLMQINVRFPFHTNIFLFFLMQSHPTFIPNILVENLNLTPNLLNEQILKIVKPE